MTFKELASSLFYRTIKMLLLTNYLLLNTCTNQENITVPTEITDHISPGSSHDTKCQPGTYSCPCYKGTCFSQPGGDLLSCVDGICVLNNCPQGSLGCSCLPNGSCDPVDGVPLFCNQQNICAEDDIRPGGIGDACDETHPCGSTEAGPLECIEGECAFPEKTTVSISILNAYSCDILLKENAGTRVALISFPSDIIGHEMRKSPLVAISLITRENAPLSGDLVHITTQKIGEQSNSPLTVKSAICNDILGRKLPNSGITIRPL